MKIVNNLVSIVIPIYNVENFLNSCVESVINQTYRNIEILLVDDGSTDSSGELADWYKDKDNRIRVFHKINGGLSDARNYGIDRARGKYITFIDSDDYVEADFIEILLSNLIKHNADISGCVYRRTASRTVTRTDEVPTIMCWDTRMALKKMLRQEDEFTTSACALLYKMNCFDGIRYPVGAYFEDLGTTYRVLSNAKKIVRTSACLYHYYRREGSISNESFSLKYMDQFRFAQEICNYINIHYPDLEKDAISRLVGVSFNIYMTITKEQMEVYSGEKNILLKTIKKHRFSMVFDRLTPIKVRIACVLSCFGMPVCTKVYHTFNMKGK